MNKYIETLKRILGTDEIRKKIVFSEVLDISSRRFFRVFSYTKTETHFFVYISGVCHLMNFSRASILKSFKNSFFLSSISGFTITPQPPGKSDGIK